MHSKKEYEVKIKKLEKRIAQLEQKAIEKEIKHKSVKKELRRLKQRIRDLIKSRDNWKKKVKGVRQELKGVKHKLTRQGKAKWHHYPTKLIGLCILLRIFVGCSFGGIVKILTVLKDYVGLEIGKIPCKNTIQNWVSKWGLFNYQNNPLSLAGKQVSLIIDESIRLGQEKLLLILSVPLEKIAQGALSFTDVVVVYMKGAKSWTGLAISEVIEELEQSYGFNVKNILSDEDSKLKNASRILEIAHVPDISHAIATCLKRVFGKAEDFLLFKKLIASYASKGVNQKLSYLCPPKQRTKARFMNLSRVVKWANKMLEKFSKLEKKEITFFKDLPAQRSFIKLLAECLALAKAVSLPFKLKGLSIQSIQEARAIMKKGNSKNAYLSAFTEELKGYMTHYEQVINSCEKKSIHVSSEIIESMFGKYKSKANSYALTGLTRLNLEIPIYGNTNNINIADLTDALETISMVDLAEWIAKNSSDNQLVKRRTFFKK